MLLTPSCWSLVGLPPSPGSPPGRGEQRLSPAREPLFPFSPCRWTRGDTKRSRCALDASPGCDMFNTITNYRLGKCMINPAQSTCRPAGHGRKPCQQLPWHADERGRQENHRPGVGTGPPLSRDGEERCAGWGNGLQGVPLRAGLCCGTSPAVLIFC